MRSLKLKQFSNEMIGSNPRILFRSSPTGNNSCSLWGLRSIVTSCKAVMLPRFGGPEVLEIRDHVEVPDLEPSEVLVRTRAVSINPLDNRMRSGYGRSIFEAHLPFILGRDISGEVAGVGNSVKSFTVGQEVFGARYPTAVRGTYTDYAILSEEELTPKPSTMSHVDASAIPFAALTAWRALKDDARIAPGQNVFVVGGGGAVGFSAIQLAVDAGCQVSTTCGRGSIERMLAAGAEQAIDYTIEGWESSIEGHFDAVLDTVGVPDTEKIGINILKRGGHYMTLQGESGSLSDAHGLFLGLPMAGSLLMKKKFQYWSSRGIDYHWSYMRIDPEGLDKIRRLSEAGKLWIPVDKTFPVTEVREAHDAKDKRRIHGKVVLEFE